MARKSGKRAATTRSARAAGATPAGLTDRQHLAAVVQQHTGATGVASRRAVDAVFETLAASLKKNRRVRLLGFGSFDVVKRKARLGRNPATGEAVRIKASKTVRFRPGGKLKDSV